MSRIREVRATNDQVKPTLQNRDKEIRFLSWQNVELKQRIATLEGKAD